MILYRYAYVFTHYVPPPPSFHNLKGLKKPNKRGYLFHSLDEDPTQTMIQSNPILNPNLFEKYIICNGFWMYVYRIREANKTVS